MPPRPPPGLNWQPLTLKFEGSLETKGDPRLAGPSDFDLLRDAHFEDAGGLQTRPPFGAVMGSGAIFGGGSLSNCRKLAKVNGELCLFTNTGFYSWNSQQSAWVLRGTHLAVTVTETPRFVTAGDQIDGDRAELAGTVVCAWTEGSQVYAAAFDKATESVLVAPTAVSTAIGRPRLVALATKILLFVEASTTLLTVRAIDPGTPGTAISGAGTTVLATNYNLYYDVVRAGTQDLVVGACRRQTTTSYEAFTVTPALVVTNSTKAFTCDGPIAVATIPDGTKTQIVRGHGTNVEGDLLTTSTLAGVFTGQAIGTASVSLNQIAAEFSTTQVGGFYACSVFWSRAESATGNDGTVVYNTVDTNNTVGSPATFLVHVGLASRAFAAQGHVFVWVVFARQNEVTGFSGATSANERAALQNTYFLYRDDGLLVAKCLPAIAGGHAASTGRLPGVSATSATGLAFAWCATGRRLIDLGGEGHTGYAARESVDVALSLDAQEARRSAVHGRTLYVADSILQQYDGTGLYETGFLIYPYQLFLTVGGGGAIPDGTYTYKGTFRFPNAQGESERSTSAFAATIINSGGPLKNALQIAPLTITKKTNARVAPAAEIWRTKKDSEPFFLASGQDPTVLAGAGNANGYIPNSWNSTQLPADAPFFIFNDNFTDEVLGDKEVNPENESLLETLVPPGARIIVPTETRLLLAGVAGDPDAWLYSRERGDGEIASFHDSLRVEVPPVGGSITALWADDQFVYVARQTAIYAYAGPGQGNDGGGQNFTLVRTISRDVGVVSQEAHAPTPVGRLIKTSKGWYVLNGGGDLRYVGGEVATFDTDTVLAVHTITAKHQVRILTDQRLLIWDYRGLIAATNPGPGRWGEWTVTGGLDAILYNDVYTILTATGPRQESASFTGLTYGLDVALAFIKPADLMGAVAVRRVMPLGEYRSAHLLRLRMYYNYDDSTAVDDVVWNPSPAVVGGPLQFAHGPKRRRCESFKVRLTAVTDLTRATLATATALSPAIPTSGSAWTATWQAATVSTGPAYGELGNALTMSVAFTAFAGGTAADLLPALLPFDFISETGFVDVRDHFTWSTATSTWEPMLNNIGVLVSGVVPVGDLEAGIADASALATLLSADANPTNTINAAALIGTSSPGQFSGGTFGAPTGEALKLSGLGLEVGLEGRLFNRLPAGQRA